MSLYLVPKSLLYVEAVADHGSIQAAARAIRIAASAIDRQIKLIEARLGTQLFDRQTTGMTLTSAGEMFVLMARRWQEDETQLLSEVRQMQGVDFGHVRLVAMDSLVNGLVPQFLKSVAQDYPRVRVDVDVATPDGAAEMLERGDCDMALCFNLRPGRDLHVLWSAELPLYCVVAPDHPLAVQSQVTLQDVRPYAIAVQSRALAIRRMLEARHSWMFENGPPPVVTNSLQLLKQLVVSGDHVALTSEMDAAPELLSGQMQAIPVVGTNIAAQSIALAVNARQSLPRIASILAGNLATQSGEMLDRLRARRL
ncbi:LysR family transcriptional regulator [Celeribacter litoreus]|uniref:LysR family transcriptional regulator n=1 Tax=Celeribacter litoreus TaxID=2876714 RepID=UPI001CC9E6DD|nr:LysR substrate-binding domain-containing protein [Celeribacter litoreus]MCA0043439.1 LysR family transcriptional regulator [Celeribacter litoreus]